MIGFVSTFFPSPAGLRQSSRPRAAAPAPRLRMQDAPAESRRPQSRLAHFGAALVTTVTTAAAVLSASSSFMPAPADALTAADVRQLTYDQVKGTGLANRCPEVTSSKGKITLDKSHKYKVVDMCLEPKQFMVEEEISRRKGEVKKEFVDTKLLTRASYSLGNVEGELVNEGGGWKFIEKEGMDYMATTVQLPGGERVPFLFTIKKLVASLTNADEGISASTEFGGDFTVPNYRTGMFLDPKGRGIAAGYDMAVALPALEADGGEGQDELQRENDKRFDVGKGSIEFAVNKVDPSTNEIGGVFVSEQPSDTDMGAKAPKRLLLKGIFYARVEPE
ncbi:hypothetical protein CDCA_CDCA01G0143 [Cyanidium caldarium]|uniref:Oxygen-evolving enhancer protein 1, chloroplastic n=1 Tax=Cyanidium caldarium TaxID=2771 RepID=A0AAV9IPF2_CYACA|nr:hypothetical protein CDCA_CDCA01G0143 [Cyanidium caldarium]